MGNWPLVADCVWFVDVEAAGIDEETCADDVTEGGDETLVWTDDATVVVVVVVVVVVAATKA